MKNRMFLLMAGIVFAAACKNEAQDLMTNQESTLKTDEFIDYAPPPSEDEIIIAGTLSLGAPTSEGTQGTCAGTTGICYRFNKNGGTWEQEVPPVPCDVILNDGNNTTISGYLKDMVWNGSDFVSGALDDGIGNTVFSASGNTIFIPN